MSSGDRSEQGPERSEPWLSVHELSQFVYCPRAGQIAFEAQTEDPGVEGRPTDLSYLPEFLLANIESSIARTTLGLCVLVVLGAVTVVTAGYGLLVGNSAITGVALLILLAVLIVCTFFWRVLFVLLKRRRLALGTPARDPIFLGDGAYPIHWWELRAAKFVARRFQQVLKDEELRIKGRPWAILVRGAECLPVFRMCGESDRVYANHMVRVAGYCRLIEACTPYSSPYGVILLPKRLDAMAIPYTSQLKEKLRGAIEIARNTLQTDRDPSEPVNKNVCMKCPFGKPRKYVAGKSTHYYKTQPLDAYTVSGREHEWHTHCGDRFHWLPPTLIAIKAPK